MADTTQTPPASTATPLPSSQDAGSPAPAPQKPQQPRRPSRMEQLNKLYALPAPLRTFPLPTFVPHNPLSLFHILYVWAQQTISPPSSHFEVLYQGYFSPDTRSVHVTDFRSVRGLWEQGFYGKGSLSRSEPSWLDREMKRRGEGKTVSSEEVTRKRRAERQQVKWERARKEREAIDLTLAAEAETEAQHQSTISPPVSVPVQSSPLKANENASDTDGQEVKILAQPFQRTSSPPVDPLRLLSLPNSSQALRSVPEVGISRPPIRARSISGSFAAPVGPLEILALPDSTEGYAMLQRIMEDHRAAVVTGAQRAINGKPRSRSNSSSSINSITNSVANVSSSCDEMTNGHTVNGHLNGTPTNGAAINGPLQFRVNGQPSKSSPLTNGTLISEINGIPSSQSTTASPIPLSPTMNVASLNGSALVNGNSSPEVKRRKSVRFSPTVEHTTFITTEPPSPERAAVVLALEEQVSPKEAQPIRNQEHYQLTLEEAFFLSYSLGALTILSPDTNRPIQNAELFSLFRRYSYFPLNGDQALAPDDPFLVSYVVYHHFRSLGWIVRGGTKFSVDYLLYLRGPVFTHAEFAILILPSYSAPYWSSPHLKNYVMSKEKKSWSWLHCVNRVITQVKKTLILVYVDIPEPVNEQDISIDAVLGRYKVREIVLKRWASNRSRD